MVKSEKLNKELSNNSFWNDGGWVKGSYTVEASFIVPMVLTVIVLLMYFAMFFHDRAILYSAAYSSAFRGSQLISGEDVFSQVEKCSKELLHNRLLATQGVETDIQITDSDISVAYSGEVPLPANALLCRYLFGNSRGIICEAAAKAKRQDVIKFVRKCRIIEGAAAKAAGK